MLKHRLIFGLTFAALFVGLLWLDWYASTHWKTAPGLFVAIASVFIIWAGLWEMRGLLARENVQISMRITVVAATLCMLWPWIEQVSENDLAPFHLVSHWFRTVKPHYLVPTVLALSLVAAVVKHSRHQRVEGAMANAGGTLLAIVYLGVLPGFFLPICMTHSAWMMAAVVGIVKSADMGAYFTGRSIGKHKLIPWLSPGKTVEGFFGGLLFSGIVGATIAGALQATGGGVGGDATRWAGISPATAIAVGALCGVILGAVGQLGDLLESLLKRDAGVKDSGALPGVGGVLDMLDSPLLAAPVAYWMLKIVLRP